MRSPPQFEVPANPATRVSDMDGGSADQKQTPSSLLPKNSIFLTAVTAMPCASVRGPSAPSIGPPCVPSFDFEVPGDKLPDQFFNFRGLIKPFGPFDEEEK